VCASRRSCCIVLNQISVHTIIAVIEHGLTRMWCESRANSHLLGHPNTFLACGAALYSRAPPPCRSSGTGTARPPTELGDPPRKK
jgi:hypothetical protein